MSASHHQAAPACPRKTVAHWQAAAEPGAELPSYDVTGGLVPVLQLHNSPRVVTTAGILTVKPD